MGRMCDRSLWDRSQRGEFSRPLRARRGAALERGAAELAFHSGPKTRGAGRCGASGRLYVWAALGGLNPLGTTTSSRLTDTENFQLGLPPDSDVILRVCRSAARAGPPAAPSDESNAGVRLRGRPRRTWMETESLDAFISGKWGRTLRPSEDTFVPPGQFLSASAACEMAHLPKDRFLFDGEDQLVRPRRIGDLVRRPRGWFRRLPAPGGPAALSGRAGRQRCPRHAAEGRSDHP